MTGYVLFGTTRDSTVGVTRLIEDLARVPDALRTEVRGALREAGGTVLAAARAKASWSSRIPPALSLKVSFSGSRAGVSIVASRKAAPHARAYEGIGSDARSFRHPLFGDREFWYAQATRPFLLPAARENYAGTEQRLVSAIDTVLTRHGFGR